LALSMYDVSVPSFERGLNALSALLDKAAAYCEEKKADPSALINARLFVDMHPFTNQVAATIMHSSGAAAKLAGKEPVYPSGLETFEALKAAVAEALARLAAILPADLEGADTREIVFKTGRGDMRFLGEGYLLSFALPNFYFHLTTAYDILRHNGLELSKRDYLGQVQMLA